MRKLNISAMLLMVLLLALSVTLVSAAEPPFPTWGTADVNGDYGEWDVDPTPDESCAHTENPDGSLPDCGSYTAGTSDWFAFMYQGWAQANTSSPNPAPKPALGDLYLRYDCNPGQNVLYVLVTTDVHNGITVDTTNPAEAHVKIKAPADDNFGGSIIDASTGDNDSTPDFHYITSGSDVIGWEGSLPLDQGSWSIRVHTQVWVPSDSDPTSETSGVLEKEIPLITLDCEETAVELVSFTAAAGTRGSVNVAWQTAAEIDNAGFNLYRSLTPNGPFVKVNDMLIGAKGKAMEGATYTFVDESGYGQFYYRLEDVDYYGVSTQYEPSFVMVAPNFLRPIFRPVMPSRSFNAH